MTFFRNLSLNSHSQSTSKQEAVAPSRRRKSGATVQTTSLAVSGKSQFQQPKGHRVKGVWTVRDQVNVQLRRFVNLHDSSTFLTYLYVREILLFLKKKYIYPWQDLWKRTRGQWLPEEGWGPSMAGEPSLGGVWCRNDLTSQWFSAFCFSWH